MTSSLVIVALLYASCFHLAAGEVGEATGSVKGKIALCSESALNTNKKIRLKEGGKRVLKIVDNLWDVPSIWMSTNESRSFTLTIREPTCKSSFVREEILAEVDDDDANSTSNSSTVATTSPKRHFYPNGYFRNETEVYAPDEYCIEKYSQTEMHVKFCKPECGVGRRRPCVVKCCPLDQVYRGVPLNLTEKQFCVHPPKGSLEFMPPFYSDINTKAVTANYWGYTGTNEGDSHLLPHFIINHPKIFKKKCTGPPVPIPNSPAAAQLLSDHTGFPYHSNRFHLRTDGAFMYKSLENKKCNVITKMDTLCVDGVRRALDMDPETPFSNTEDEYINYHCSIPEKDDNSDRYLSVTLGILLLTTSPFPFMTSLVYILLWRRQNIHGWTIAATSGSLFFMYIFHGTAHLIGITLKSEALNTFYCQFLGVLTHFFMMATFTWLTVMSCDLWLTFRAVRPMNQRLEAVPRYLKYSAFGWGFPAAIVAVGVIMDFVIYKANDCSHHAVPAYGQQSCWIVESSLGEYLYYPAAVLLCVNISLFSITCLKLCRYGRGPRIRTKKNDAFGECFSRFTKLFCIMGISWVFEIVSWYVDGLGFVWYWNVIDLFNILRAIAVFAIYVCKKDIMLQLEEAYPCLRRVFRPFGKLFLRKCSDEISTESTVFSALPHSSPAQKMKTVSSCATLAVGGESGKKLMETTLNVPQ